MSDSEIHHNNPQPGPAEGAAGEEPVSFSPSEVEQNDTIAHAGPAQDGASADEQATASQGRFAGLRSFSQSRHAFWAAVAGLCIAVGTVGSLLGAHAVARSDAEKAHKAFPRTSAGIASTLKLAIQREEELGVSASTFFAANPKASAAEFDKWVKWAHTLRRYPELQKLGLVALVRAPELAAFEARTTGHADKPKSSSTAPTKGDLRIVPSGARSYYCFSAAELSRSAAGRPPAGLDYCAVTPGLLSSRDSGRSVYTRVSAGGRQTLAIETPVYRGNVLPATLAGRRAAFVGWLREVIVPGVVMAQALHGHPGYATRLRYKAGSSNVVFAAGTPQPGAPSAVSSLHNGWTVKSFGPVVAAGVLDNGNALTLLIAGIVLSLLLGLLVYVIGAGHLGTPAKKPSALPPSDLYDALTRLPNRALTLDRAERMVARAGRQSGMLAGALMIDIDWFKDVNDKLGQTAGDQLLRIVARRLEGVIRAEDTVGRIGGDEFVVLVESAARGVRLDSLAGRIIESLHKPVELDDFGPSFFATASIGVAFGRYETPDDLMRDAQLALYSAKAAGKDRYTLFNANMRSMIESRGVLEAELNAALLDGQFFLMYQPIFDLRTRRVVGLEALIRWLHPKRGMLMPDDFIALAEENGLIVPIGRWALEEACARTAAWNVAGHRVGISVKVSANQLNRDGFVTDVRRALQQSGIEPALLTLEIAEATVMRDVEETARRIEEVKQLGVRIAIDDFGGSGYARHSDLQRMPLDVLKVDRSSLAASDDEAYRSWLLEAILIVGRDLSLDVLATGIETYEQMSALQAMGCTMAQGFFLAEPTPTEAVERLFSTELPTAPPPPAAAAAPVAPAAPAAPAPSGPFQ